jgi:hypothetical protein
MHAAINCGALPVPGAVDVKALQLNRPVNRLLHRLLHPQLRWQDAPFTSIGRLEAQERIPRQPLTDLGDQIDA